MRQKTVFALSGAAAVGAILAIAAVVTQPRVETSAGNGAPVFPGLAEKLQANLKSVVIRHAGGTISLDRDGNAFHFRERANYPADPQKVVDLVVDIARLTKLESKTNQPDRYARLDLQDPTEKGSNAKQEASGGASCPVSWDSNSFVPGTLVLMADGSCKKIEDLRKGEFVLATDPTTGKSGARKVTQVRTKVSKRTMVEVSDSSGGKIKVTDEHPFWVESEKRWVNAIDLKPTYRFLAADNRPAEISGTRTWSGIEKVHNFAVDELHTYYVASSQESAPVLVHNEDARKSNGNPCGPTVFMTPDDPVQKSIPRQKSLKGFGDYHDVWIHGNIDAVSPDYDSAESNNNTIKARSLARAIRASSNYPGGPVRLCSCNTGSARGSFAQHLANALGQNVLAPEGYLYVWPDGGHNIGPDGAPLKKNGDSGGRWKMFRPEERRR